MDIDIDSNSYIGTHLNLYKTDNKEHITLW